MNWVICCNAWKECLRSNLRMTLLTLFFLGPIALSTGTLCVQNEFPANPLSNPNVAVNLALVWSAGMIGRQLQDGTLSLVLSRPLTIGQLVISKWFAIGTAAASTALLQLVAEVVVGVTRAPLPTTLEIFTNGLERVLIAYSVSASMVLLSSLVGGVKDLGLYLFVYLLNGILDALSQMKVDEIKNGILKMLASFGLTIASYLSSTFTQFLGPRFEIYQWLSTGTFPWLELFAYLALVTGSLSLAIFLLNRKELPYGAV